MKKPTIKIAVQRKGRLSSESIEFLKGQKLEFDENTQNLLVPCSNKPVTLLLVRDDDIPEYVGREVADFGIIGKNVLFEKNVKVNVIKNLGFGFCDLVIAVPKKSKIKNVSDLEGMRIATSYPRILKQYCKEQDINVAIIPIKGAVEVTPSLNIADAVCDMTQTGKTLKENKLKVLTTILKSEAVLISSKFTSFKF